MLDISVKIISSLLLMGTVVYSWYKLLNEKINFKNWKLYVTIIGMSATSILNYYIVNQYIRILSITVVLMLFIKILFKQNIQKCIITPLFTQMIIMISELFFAVIILVIFGFENDQMYNTQSSKFLTNLLISIIYFIIINIPFVCKSYRYIIKITDKIKHNQLIIFSICIVFIANILTMILYFKATFGYLLVFNSLMTLFCLMVVVYSFKNKNNYIKIHDKYNTTLNSLKEYEDILDRYRISNHENKNQLLTIRGMLPNSNKEIGKYIDEIVDRKLNNKDKIMVNVSKIPAGGLRGLVYSKLLVMKEENIEYILEISRDVKTTDLINIEESLMLDICQIIGVYLDNAIDEVIKLNKKYISIEMYKETKCLVIEISNNYKNPIDLDKIEIKGYTTKEKGHGYGLALTKEIIENNSKLNNEKRITKEIFTQILKIKM